MDFVEQLASVMRGLLLPNIALGLIFISATLVLSIRKREIKF